MDPPGYGRPDPRRREQGRYSITSVPLSSRPRSQERSAYHSNQLARSASPGVVADFHRSDRGTSSRNMPVNPSYPDALFAWRQRQGGTASERSQGPHTHGWEHRSPGVRLEDMGGRRVAGRHGRHLNTTTLYPQMSPYEDQHRSISTPENFGSAYRSISQPNTPALHQSQRQVYEQPLYLNPRSPTYPPATNRRSYHPSSAREEAFNDEDDFCLFAEATAGLGPEEIFQRTGSAHSSPGIENQLEGGLAQESVRPQLQQLSSPVEPTPTTLFALQQLAQMPQGSRLETRQQSANSIEEWIQSTSQSQDFDLDEDEEGFVTDELPDYAASQAQAQAVQRAEATRRAQELQRRWQQSRNV